MFCALVVMALSAKPDADFAELPLSLLFNVGFHYIDYHYKVCLETFLSLLTTDRCSSTFPCFYAAYFENNNN